MPRTASLHSKRTQPTRDAGFSLTELIAGLLVASLLMAGLVEIIRRYARTTDTVRTTAAELRSTQVASGLLEDIERLDPGSLSVSRDRIEGMIGNNPLNAEIVASATQTLLQWSSPRGERSVALPSGAHFQRLPSGAVALVTNDSSPPIALAYPRRTIPYDCQFDTVARECRQ